MAGSLEIVYFIYLALLQISITLKIINFNLTHLSSLFYLTSGKDSTQVNFGLFNSTKSYANIQNLFTDKIFDSQTSLCNTISTVKEVWPSISVCQSQSLPVYWDFPNRKNTKGSPLWNEKKFLSPILLKLYMWDSLTIRISNFEFHRKKKIFDFFSHFT